MSNIKQSCINVYNKLIEYNIKSDEGKLFISNIFNLYINILYNRIKNSFLNNSNNKYLNPKIDFVIKNFLINNFYPKLTIKNIKIIYLLNNFVYIKN